MNSKKPLVTPANYSSWLFIWLIAIVFLAAMGAIVPIALEKYASPWLGLPISAAAFWLWLRYGPPPSPGFASGILCLMGSGFVVGLFLVCVILGIRNFMVS